MGKYLSKDGVTRLTQKFKAMFAAKEKPYGVSGTNWNALKLLSIRVKVAYADQSLEFSLTSRDCSSARFSIQFYNGSNTDPTLQSFTYVGADTAWAGRVHLYKMERETGVSGQTEKVWEVWLTPYHSHETGHVYGLTQGGNFSVTIDNATATALPSQTVSSSTAAYPRTLFHTVCKPGTWQAGNGRFSSLNIMDAAGSTILGGVSVGTSESNFQGAQNSKLWLGWRGGKRAMAFDSSGNANIGPATEVDAAYRLTVEGDLHVKGSVVADTPAGIQATPLTGGKDIDTVTEPGWYSIEASSDVTNSPGSISGGALLLVTPAYGGHFHQIFFIYSRFNFGAIYLRQDTRAWYRLNNDALTLVQ